MPSTPLTHHDILALVAPFTRSGRQLDMAASDRVARVLRFKPVQHAGLVETWQLEHKEDGQFELQRLLTRPEGLQARASANGSDLPALLAQLDAVPPARQFQHGPGYGIAHHYRLHEGACVLVQATAGLAGLNMTLQVPKLSRIPAELTLQAAPGDTARNTLQLPEDLLAVQGFDWARLQRTATGWRSSLRLRGKGPARTADAEAKFARTAQHLVQTLAQPPALFHTQRLGARWRVYARRSTPLLVCLGLIAGALAVPSLQLGPDSVFRMLIFNAPPLLLVLFFSLREMPRVEIPPWPRALPGTSWQGRQQDPA